MSEIALYPQIKTLTDAESKDFFDLITQLDDQRDRNQERWAYYTSEQHFRNLGIAIDPKFEPYVTILGWCGKAVRSLANRVKFDGFVVPGETEYYSGMNEQLRQTRLVQQFYWGLESSLVYGCGFFAFTKGDRGEPDAIARAFSARNATAIWDDRIPGRLRVGLVVAKRDKAGHPLTYILFYPDKYITLRRAGLMNDWEVIQSSNPVGSVTMVPQVIHPTLDKPWGQSRISRPMMGIVDGAIRTNLRAEINGEFYSYPQMVAMNIKPADINLHNRMGKAMVIDYERDKSGRPVKDAPETKIFQLETSTTQPNLEQLKTAALNFAAEAALSPDKLGVVYDNPSSADAIDRADAELNTEAEMIGSDSNYTLVDSLKMMDMVARGSSIPREELLEVQADFRDPGMITRYSQKLAAAQLYGAGMLPPGEAVSYEIAGMTKIQVSRLVAAAKKAEIKQARDAMLNQRQTAQAVSQLAQSAQAAAGPGITGGAGDTRVQEALAERGEG